MAQCCEIVGKTPCFTINYKAKKEKSAIHSSFRYLLFKDLIGYGEVFYVKVHNKTNPFLWKECLDVRDSGPSSIGSIFCFFRAKINE